MGDVVGWTLADAVALLHPAMTEAEVRALILLFGLAVIGRRHHRRPRPPGTDLRSRPGPAGARRGGLPATDSPPVDDQPIAGLIVLPPSMPPARPTRRAFAFPARSGGYSMIVAGGFLRVRPARRSHLRKVSRR